MPAWYTTTYTLISGTITFSPTNQDGTRTTVTCNPQTFVGSNSTTCTVTVTDLATGATGYPTGNITFGTSVNYFGTFTPGTCALSSGSCSVQFRPSDGESGTMPIYVAYGGDSTHYSSAGKTLVYVTPSE